MNNEDVLQRNDAGELEIRTAPSTGDTGTNPDDVYTRDEQGRLCVRTTGSGGGGGGTTPTAADVSFDPTGTSLPQTNVQGAIVQLDFNLQSVANSAGNTETQLNTIIPLVQKCGFETMVEDTLNVPATTADTLLFDYAIPYKDPTNEVIPFEVVFAISSGSDIISGKCIFNIGNTEVVIYKRTGVFQNYNINILSSSGYYFFAIQTNTGYIPEGTYLCQYSYYGAYAITKENAQPMHIVAAQYKGLVPVEETLAPIDMTNVEVGQVLIKTENGYAWQNLPQTNYGLKISDTFTQAVNTATTYNLFTNVDLASDVTLAANMEASNYSLVDGALKLPTNAGYVDYGIEVRLNGSFAGGENTNREFSVQLQRADGTVISEKSIVKVSGNDLSKRSVVFETYTDTETDPFIANGLKLVINNTSGQTLNLTGCDILIKARA